MFAFHYRKISSSLINEIASIVCNGDSVTLLGPRYGGKGDLMKSLRQVIERETDSSVVWVDLARPQPVTTGATLSEILLETVNAVPGGESITKASTGGLFDPIDQLSEKLEKPVIALFSYVDGIAHSLARSLLRAVRPRVMDGKLIAVLCGEMDLRHLVHGPNSEFNCAHQYVLQGYDLDEFSQRFRRYAISLNLKFKDETGAARLLLKLTGGNVHILRILLGSIIESRVRSGEPQLPELDLSDIPQTLSAIQPPGMRRADTFRYSMRVINNEPDCWNDLNRLINGQPVEVVGLEKDQPSILELAGVAVREGTRLHFSSPLMAEFQRNTYVPRRFGDLFARNGQWDEAFRQYEKLSPEERLRPSSADDRAEVILMVKTLSAALFSKAAVSVEAVKQFFSLGCRYVLGFSEITFWQLDESWRIQPFDGFPSNSGADYSVINVLPNSTENAHPGIWLPLNKPISSHCLIAILPGLRADRLGAVVVGNHSQQIVISRERELLTKELLENFVKAYGHAIKVETSRIRLETRNKHIELINSIFEGLGKNVLNPKQVLSLAAEGLRSMWYRRVLFCLVDDERKRIKGVLDSSDQSVNIADMTDYALDDPLADLQPYIIYTKKWKIVPDATKEPLANKKAVNLAGMKAEMLVPLINPLGEAIGTIHVERIDGAVPTTDEAEDLQTFGRQLAVAIEQSKRVSLLQSALDKIPEPLVIVDNAINIRYANQPGADLLSIEPGWCGRIENNDDAEHGLDEEAQKMIRASLNTGQRAVHHVQRLSSQTTNQSEYRREMLTDILQDWGGKTIGGLLHIRDFSYLYQVSQAFRLVFEASDAQSAIRAMLEAAKLLKYKWGRLYLIDENDPDRLVPRLSFGFKNKTYEENFNSGQIDLPRRHTPNVETWMSIEQGKPLVFYYTKQLPDRSKYVTRYGLEATVTHQTQRAEELEKHEEDFWLDIPLGTPESLLGKMTLDCDKDLRPENFEIMKMLLEIASGNLAAHLQRDLMNLEKLQTIRKTAAEKIMASLAHNIATRLASMPLLLARYRAREENPHSLKSLNDDFQKILDDTLTTIKRAKERLAAVVAQTAKVDLFCQIQRTLESALPEKCFLVESQFRPLEAEVDSHLLELALLEMVQNSRDATEDSEQISVKIKLEAEQVSSNDWVRITYEDNGPGVPEDLKKTIFEDFFSRRPNKKTGTGLGLGFVCRVIEAHGGVILENGKFGQGARFTMVFPKEQSSANSKENGYVSHSDC